ncbi:FMN oxidoreductase [Pseudomonas sp. R4-39-08]|nr:FMN oxidoreductase [Pseudomonas sp. R4-39-08]
MSGDFLEAFSGESAQPTAIDNLARRLEKEEFDFITVGRVLLSDAQ